MSDESALFNHYYMNHKNNLTNSRIEKVYKVIFIEHAHIFNLDYKVFF